MIIVNEPSRAFKKARGLWTKLGPGFSGFGIMYCGLSIEPGPTGSGLGPFQLYWPDRAGMSYSISGFGLIWALDFGLGSVSGFHKLATSPSGS